MLYKKLASTQSAEKGWRVQHIVPIHTYMYVINSLVEYAVLAAALTFACASRQYNSQPPPSPSASASAAVNYLGLIKRNLIINYLHQSKILTTKEFFFVCSVRSHFLASVSALLALCSSSSVDCIGMLHVPVHWFCLCFCYA